MEHDIAVGVDGSPASLAAAHWAAQEAQRRGSGLVVVHACNRHPRPAPNVPLDRAGHDRAEEILHEAVRSVAAAHPALRVTERLVRDSTAAALVAAAADSAMLVLGSLGPGPVTGLVTGAVSQRVVARSPHPVVLVRPGRGAGQDHLPATDGVAPDEIPRTPYREIVLGLDTDRPCDEVIAFAFEAARWRGTGLRVIHAFRAPARPASDASLVTAPPAAARPVSPWRAPGEAQADAERSVTAVLRAWREKYPDVPVTESVTEGRAAAALRHAARGAGLLVVGRRTTGHAFAARTGPVTHAALQHAGCPVAVVPHD